MTVPSDGWYPDPQLPGVERWWSQGAWTGNVRPSAPSVPPGASAPIGPSAASGPSVASGGQWRNRWPLAVIAALILVAGVVLLATHGRTGDFTVHGSMSLVGTDNFASFGDNCAGSAGYDDLRDGAEVVISENGGKTVAVGTLEGSHSAGGECLFRFDISGVPSGKGFYGILVTHRGVVQFSEREMRDGPALTIGAGS